MKQRYHIIVHGLVQGVAFRANTQKIAQQLNLTGWVRNLPDSSVEIVAEGEEENLIQLREWCKVGPARAQVTEVIHNVFEYKDEFENFEIQY